MIQNLEKQLEFSFEEETITKNVPQAKPKRKGLRFITYSLVSAMALGAGYCGYKIYEENTIQRAKIEYEKKHAYDITPEEVNSLCSIKKSQKDSEESLLNLFFDCKHNPSVDEKDFLFRMEKRLNNIVKEPDTAYARLSSNEKKDFDEFSKKYDNYLQNYREFLNELDNVKKEHEKYPSPSEKFILAGVLLPRALMADAIIQGATSTDKFPVTSVLGDIVTKEEPERDKIGKIYNAMLQKKNEFENERAFLKIVFKSDEFEFDNMDNSNVNKLLYFFYSKAKPTLLTNK